MMILTKKQKAKMRERRRKKKLSLRPEETTVSNSQGLNSTANCEQEENENPQDDQVLEQRQTTLAVKRKRDDAGNLASSSYNEAETATSMNGTEGVLVKIRLPSSSSGTDVKKFRKDWRRKIRKKYPGIKSENIVFEAYSTSQEAVQVISISEPKQGTIKQRGDDKSKKKSSFPRINDILAQQKLATAAEEERQKRMKEEKEVTVEEKMKYVALDCEMVGIGTDGKKSALARVSIVNWDHETLLDTFVTVPERVTDFRTWVSGVRAKDIQYNSNNNRVMELTDCRTLVGNIIKDKIVVGHALKNDFQALLLDHPKTHVRDTARYKPFMRHIGKHGGKHRPRKLRDLVEEKLGRMIQVKGESHNSVDDAIAAMELYKLERVNWENEIARRVRKRGV